MRLLTFPFILLFTALLCSAALSDTFELPRKEKSVTPFQTEEIRIAGQKRFRILTDRYDITAFSVEEGTLVGQQLEHLFNAWELMFAEFLKDVKIEPTQDRHKIVLYRNKQEYSATLFRIDPFIARLNGLYYAQNKTAYFFPLETETVQKRVIFHEGTHQILETYFSQESTPEFRNNYWLVEGIALFMQTLKIEEKHYKIGDILDDRLFSARIYQFEENYNLPIRILTRLNMADIQGSVNVQKIYSQSTTLTHWLMFAEKGRYRKALFELLRQTYLDTANLETLSNLIGLSYEELDKKYVEFLKTIPE